MYLGNQMKMLDQEVLEDHLRTLNFNELKIALRGGVPGHCNFIANQLLNEFKEKIDAYVHAKE
ncbi:MAG: hypothetical protein KAJ10_05290 [Thermodesulfovibrionia bacterium]|nr:hypothetical protein [Thermodesulfovibrionia bacterium]